jgi:glycosyltransferase involved in cell wall biosynthesis
MKFSLIIPCYNEAANLPLLLERCEKLIEQKNIEILLVDNGSTDESQKVLQDLILAYPGFRVVRLEENKGYGFGILAGLRASRGDVLGWTHADMQTDPMDMLLGLKIFEKYGMDVFIKGRRHERPLGDVAFTIGMSFFETLLLFKPMWDINAQPTMFSRQFFESWEHPPHDFSLDLFAYYQAKVKGVKVYRFPVLFGQRAHGLSHWNVNWTGKWKFICRTVGFSLKLKKKT